MRIAVTGGAGFIASQVADAYLSLGHEVLIIDNLSTGLRANVNPKARLVEADIRSEAAAKVLEDFAPQVLNLHAADRPAAYAAGKPGEQRKSVLSNRRALEVLGWKPSFDVDRGIAATIAWNRTQAR